MSKVHLRPLLKYLRNISGISKGISLIYLMYISGLSHAYLRFISSKSQEYLRIFSVKSQTNLITISGTSEVYQRYISNLSKHVTGIFQQISSKLQAKRRQILDISLACLRLSSQISHANLL